MRRSCRVAPASFAATDRQSGAHLTARDYPGYRSGNQFRAVNSGAGSVQRGPGSGNRGWTLVKSHRRPPNPTPTPGTHTNRTSRPASNQSRPAGVPTGAAPPAGATAGPQPAAPSHTPSAPTPSVPAGPSAPASPNAPTQQVTQSTEAETGPDGGHD